MALACDNDEKCCRVGRRDYRSNDYWMGLVGSGNKRGGAMRLSEFLLGTIVAVGFFFISLNFVPTIWWYEYKSIVATKPVWTIGENLKLVSTIEVQQPGTAILYEDEFRCIADLGDETIQTNTFSTALQSSGVGFHKVPWFWGKVPASTPLGVPCYIRSVQTMTTIFGIERVTVYESEQFTVSEFDYTRQKSQ